MSEQVENPPPAEIVPAKSEDKLEIEKEEENNKVEKESDNKEQEEAKAEPVVEEEKSEKDEKQAEKSDESKEEADKKDSEQKDENEPAEKGAEEASDKKDTDEAAAGSDSKKKFKIPDVKLKTPKVPGFLRSKSKDRKKDDGEEAKEGEEKKEEGDEATAEDAEAGEGTSKDAKAKVKEAMEKLPKMPKIHKPAFLKKGKKEGGEPEEDQAEEGGEDKKEGDEAEGEAAADEETKKKTLVDSLKGLKGQLLSKKGGKAADKDPEAGGVDGEEESKELLDKDKAEEEGGDKKEGEEGKTEEAGGKGFMDYLRSAVPPFFKKSETTVDEEKGEKELEEVKVEQPDNKDEDATDGVAEGEKEKLVEGNKDDDDTASHKSEKKDAEKEEEAAAAAPSAGGRGAAILESLRNVASQVPSMFKNKQKEKTKSGGVDHDVEAGEKDELLEKGEGEEAAKAADSKAAEGDEAPAEGSGDEAKPWDKHLCRAKQCGTQALDRFNGLDKTKRLAAAGLCGALLFILLIIVIVCAALPSGYSNDFRIVDCSAGKCVETESFCGRIQGLVEGPDQFAFTRIPYTAEPPTGTNRWRHSTTFTDLSHCHEGTLVAHSHNDSAGSCWRRYPTGADGDEDCTNLDVYTSSVVYDKLMPVVVYIDGGDDLNAETEKLVQPSASLAKNQSVVFVKVNYRRGVFGFLSLDSLSGREYPKHSGNYGLGDIISALKWIKRNIQHFGGHPKMVTLLGRGEGATLVTTLTATAEAKGLFKQVWATNGAGVLSDKELDDANRENKVLFEKLNCENEEEEADCLVDLPTPEDLVKAVPYEWSSARQRKLPKQGESQLGHSWVIIDKHILKESPYTYWKDNKLSNNVPIVFGSTAQGAVTLDNWNFKTDWNDQDSYEAQVEESLGSFNVSIPKSAMEKYSQDDNWLAYASMLTDIRRVCPLQDLARTVAESFQAQVYSYVATQPRAKLNGVADSTSDIEAILGVYVGGDGDGDAAYVANIQKMFYEFVSTGRMHQNKDVLAGVYTVGAEIATHAHYPNCEFWKSAQSIVPSFADYN